ncbi:MAG: hypothetical protein KKA73_25865 [Chloroflexi bacterium]|nr:hypothetical protein [Chloroflexota bacterium]MBU1751126.1 hypothetical protein [Chloroflexota bacterium]MBU1878785.1 hypothetical protein [Chloroflexota bacterium]
MSVDVSENHTTPVEEKTLAGSYTALVEAEADGDEEKRRRRLFLLLLMLLALLLCVCVLFGRYLQQPAPLPEILPVPVNVNYAPHYLFSIYGLDGPVGVALSPQGDRVYVAETSGDRLIKVFTRNGDPVSSFAPPRTKPAHRSPVYLATDHTGRVFVSDRLQHAIFVYDRDGSYQDTILAPDLTLSEYVSKHVASLQPTAVFTYNWFEANVYYQNPGETAQTLPAPDRSGWSPLGVRIEASGRMLLGDVAADQHSIRMLPGDMILAPSWRNFGPPEGTFTFGCNGQSNGQFLFPNVAVTDSQGRFYVTDGNNGRISVWNDQSGFLFNFGQGAGEGALNLPRGAAMDARDRLHVVDAVGQNVKVYDVAGPEPNFLFAFGGWGLGDGQFNYPNDIVLDTTGRLYITDRENNRVQVWSY